MLTQQQLKNYLSYDPESGVFIRVKDNSKLKSEKILGTKHSTGYVVIRVNDKLYKAHRLAWLYMNGEFPSLTIDHINRDGFDNRWENLREVTQKQNSENRSVAKNNTSGHPGVDWAKKLGKWRARITVNYKGFHIGYFDTKEKAIEAYRNKAAEMHTHNFLAKSRVNTYVQVVLS
jgi:hypothetical protein